MLGMPYPQNVEAALAVEDIVRNFGAEPATIALLDGKVRIGLDPSDIDRLGRTATGAVKASRRDLGLVLAKRWT
ncbi:hypothetical protein HK100_007408, partial [Physocladia obscura]